MATPSAHNQSQQPARSQLYAICILFILTVLFFHQIVTSSGFFFGDFANYEFMKLKFHTGQIARGTAPTWCSYHDLGRPIGQMAWHSPFYPLYIILAPFSSDAVAFEYMVSLVYVFQVFWAALGTFLLLRFWKISVQSALVGALSVAFCSSVVVTMTSANNGAGYSWIPWIMLGLEHLRNHSDAFSWRGFRMAIITGAAVGCCFLISVIQRAVHEALFISVFGIFILAQLAFRKQWAALMRFIVYSAAAALLGFAISAVMILPALGYYTQTTRLGSHIYKDTNDQVPWRLVLTNIIPNIFGRVHGIGSAGTWLTRRVWPNIFEWVHGPFNKDTWSLFWGGNVPLQEHWNFWCRVNYTGLLPVLSLFLLPWWLWKNRNAMIALFACIALFMLVYMYGIENPLQYAIADTIPIFKGFRIPVRYAFFMSLPLALIAAFILDSIWPKQKSSLTIWFYAFSGAAALLIIAAGLIGLQYVPNADSLPGLPPAFLSLIQRIPHRSIMFQLVLLGLFCISYALAARGTIKVVVAKWALVGIVFIDLFMFAGHINNANISAAQSNANNPISALLKKRADDAGPEGRFRFEWNAAQANLRAVMWEVDSYNGYIMSRPPHEDTFRKLKKDHTDLYYDLWNVRYKIFQVQSQQELNVHIRSVPPWAQAFARQGIIIQERTNALPRVWFVSDAVIKSEEDALAFMQSDSFDPRQTVVLAEPGPNPQTDSISNTQFSTGTHATLKKYDHTEISVDVNAPVPGYVVFSELYYKGWQASVDGLPAPVLRADIALRAVQVPAGAHELTLTYKPAAFKVGFILYIAGFLVVIPGILIRGKKPNRS
jgi:hypothetical protein